MLEATGVPAACQPPGDGARNPLVYVSFGSVTAGLGPFGAIYAATLHAIADLPIRVLMTTGDGLDPASLGPIPGNARVERWWPQAEVMRHATASIGHGGFGTTMMALQAGVPQVVVPLFAADQYVNAHRVARADAGIEVLGGPAAADHVRAALLRLIDDSTFSEGATRVAADMAALPDVSTSPMVLSQLSTARVSD